MIFPGFAGGAYSEYSPSAAMQECINLIPRTVDAAQEKSKLILVGTPGLAAFATLPYYPIRGMWGGDGRTFVVATDPADTTKAGFFEVMDDGTYVNRSLLTDGVLLDDDGTPVTFAANGNQLLIVSGGSVYCDSGTGPVKQRFTVKWDGLTIDAADATKVTTATGGFDATDVGKTLNITGGTGFTVGTYTISSVAAGVATLSGAAGTVGSTGGAATELFDYIGASHCVFLDGFFIVSGKSVTGSQTYGPKQINISDLYDGTSWSPLDYAVKEAYPDNIATLLVDHEELFIFGDSNSTEVWQNTGADFPFQRNPGAIIHQAAAPNSCATSVANGVAWIGGDTRGWSRAYIARGYQPTPISTAPIERIWAGYSTINDAVAYTYTLEGHSLLVINFPTGNATWVWDATTGLWHQWASGEAFDRHKVMYHTYEWGMHLGADHTTGDIYKIDHTVYTDDGDPIYFRRTMPHACDEQQRVAHHCFRLDHESSADVEMTLAWSDDSGRHWSTEHAPSGVRVADGESDRPISSEWRRLGTSRDRVYRLTGSGDGKRALVQAYLNPKD